MARVELYREQREVYAGTDYEGMPFAVWQSGKWRWRYVSNGHIMADSGQGYSRRIDCLNGAATVLGGYVRPDHIERDRHGGAVEVIPVRDLTREAKP